MEHSRQGARKARRIVAIDEGVVPFSEAAVQGVLQDLSHYAQWWPAPFRFQAEPSPAGTTEQVRVWNGPWVSWVSTLTGAAPGRIDLAYSGGAWEGEARWSLRPVLGGTAVVFRVEIDPKPWWLRFLAWRVDLNRRHSRQMKGVFAALTRRLDALGAVRIPEPEPASGPPPLFPS
jgi:hypothetical protein